MTLELPEATPEGDVLLDRRMLLRKEEHLVVHQQREDRLCFGRPNLPERHAAHLGAEGTREPD